MKDLRNELLTSYMNRTTDFQRIHELCKESDIAGPFLMSSNEAYPRQKSPFLVIGQETMGWETCNYPITKEECERMMDFYEDFNVGEKYRSTPFWNTVRKIEDKLGNEPYTCEWTNISKYDLDSSRPDAEHEQIFSSVDNLLLDEIRILEPKVCVFFTGHSFDYRIKNIFNGVDFLPVNEFEVHQFCQLKHDKLPLLTFRTYHPKYLVMSGLAEDVIECIGKMSSDKR
jgi:hypothetical protein